LRLFNECCSDENRVLNEVYTSSKTGKNLG